LHGKPKRGDWGASGEKAEKEKPNNKLPNLKKKRRLRTRGGEKSDCTKALRVKRKAKTRSNNQEIAWHFVSRRGVKSFHHQAKRGRKQRRRD